MRKVVEVTFRNEKAGTWGERRYKFFIDEKLLNLVSRSCRPNESFYFRREDGYTYNNAIIKILSERLPNDYYDNGYRTIIQLETVSSHIVYSLDEAVKEYDLVEAYNKEEDKKGENNMFNNLMKKFEFGVADDIALSVYGSAFKTKDGSFISYDTSRGEYVEVEDFIISDKNPLCFKMPVAVKDVKVNDYIRHQGNWVRVIEKQIGGRIVAEKIAEKEVVTILPTKNIFGFNFYTKLLTFDNMMFQKSASENNPFGNMFPYLIMSQSFGSNKKDNASLLPMMMLMNDSGYNLFNNPLMMMCLMGDQKDNILPLFMMQQFTNSGASFNFMENGKENSEE